MKLSASVLAALLALAIPASASADLVAEPPPSPASDPPPAGSSDPAASDKPSSEPAGGPSADAPPDPTSSVAGPPKGGCASCAIGHASATDAMLAMLISALATSLAFERRRRGRYAPG